MKKKLILLFMLTFILTSVLAACGTKENNDAGNNVGSNDQTNQKENNDEEKKTADTDKKDSDNTIIVGTEAGFAPYEYMVGDQVVGIDMDIAQAIADHLGKELIIRNMDFDGALMAVQNGLVDFVAAGVSIREDRLEVMDFSIEYVDSTEVVVVNKENPAVVECSVEGLAGKVIGVQQGNIADFWVEENVEAKDIKRYAQFSQAAEDLKNRKIDCIVMDQLPAENLVETNPELTIIDGTLFEDKYAIAVKKGNTELLNEINTVIQKLIDEGKIEEFTRNHTSK